jgi:DNA-binding CsgD family transcriptional regulator/tetratricopeptide (TPR) repeat protein
VQVVVRGRSDPMARALQVMRESRAGGGSTVLTVTGGPGIGKTTLLDAVVTEALSSGFRAGCGKAEEMGQIAPGAPLFTALRSGRRPLLEIALVAAWESLADRPLELVEPVSDGLERLAAQAPVLVTIDDVQWADPMSRVMLRTLIGRLAGCTVIWVLAARSSGADVLADLTALAGADVPVVDVRLGPLTVPDLLQMARDRLGAEPSAPVRRMLEKVDGNPLVAMQVIEGAARAARDGTSEEQIPTEFIMAARGRRDRLDPGAAAVVDVGAVLGRPFAVEELAAIQGEPVSVTGPALKRAVESDILRQDDHLVGFAHDLMREAVYSGILEHRRRELHMRCARHLAGAGDDLLAAATHVRAGARIGDEDSADFLRRAARYALVRLPEAAGSLILDALRMVRPSQPSWLATAEEGVELLSRVERFADAVQVSELALSRTTDPQARARLYGAMARAMYSSGRAGEAVRRLEVAIAEPGHTATAQARLVALHALALTRIGEPERARTAVGAALGLGQEVGDRQAELTAVHARAELDRNCGNHAEAMAAYRRLRLARPDRAFVAEEVWELQMLDRFEESDRMLRTARAQGRHEDQAAVLWAQMWHDFNLCRLDEAELDARQLITTCDELGGHMLEIDAYLVFSSTALMRGDLATARRRLGLREARSRTDDFLRRPTVRLLHGWMAAAEGSFAEAMSIMSEELATAHESRTFWPWWPGWMPLLTHVGRAAGDQRFVSSCVELAVAGAIRNPGVASFEGLALHVQGLSTTDVGLLEGAVQRLSDSPRPELHAHAVADLGRALLLGGRSREGMTHLDRAWEAYQRLGIHGGRDSVQRVMRRAGAHRAKWVSEAVTRPSSGWASLTPAERRIAELITAGHTNRAVAESLRISPNTVATHMRSIFEKLGVHSRVQLANARHQQQEPSRG